VNDQINTIEPMGVARVAHSRVDDLYSPEYFGGLSQLATAASKSRLFGDATPDQLFMILMTGKEMQLTPTVALRNIGVFKNKTVISSQLQMAKVKEAGYLVEITENTAERATVSVQRKGEKAYVKTFTLADATLAGLLTRNDLYKTNPATMLLNRAIGLACRYGAPEVLNGLGLLRANEGQRDEAIEYFEKALQLRPNFAEAEVNLGQTLASLGRTNEAKRLYEGVLCLNTNHAAAHINLGKLLAAEGRTEDAAQHYAQAVQLKPDNAIGHFNFGNALARLGRFAEALGEYQQAVRLRPAFPEAHLALGLELARADRAGEAIAQFQETLRLQPQSVEAHQNLGVALARQKRYAEAFKEFQAVLEIQPRNPTAQKYLEQVRDLMKQ